MIRMIGLVSVLWPAVVLAQSGPALPEYDPPTYCRTSQQRLGIDSQSLLNGCLMNEQAAYDGLKGRWSQIPARIRQYCTNSSARMGITSYSLLQGCLINEEAASQQNQQFQFRR